MGELLRGGDAGEEDTFALGEGHCFFAIASGLVTGPKADRVFIMAEVDDMVSSFTAPDLVGPPDLKKVTGLCLFPLGEVDAAIEVGDEFGATGSVGIPASKDAMPVFLVACDDEFLRHFGCKFLGGLQ